MVKVKVCGITNLDDALIACALGADAVGFIFYAKSPRYVQPETAKSIIQQLPPFVTSVGVFVNSPLEVLNKISRQVSLRIVQLHGDEEPAYCQQLTIPVIKVFRVQDEFDFKVMRKYEVSAFLLDTFTENHYGGTGKPFNWQLARQAKKGDRIILSGGLNAGNVQEALRNVNPYAVDVCSGVEAYPGKKDHDKLKSFFKTIHAPDDFLKNGFIFEESTLRK